MFDTLKVTPAPAPKGRIQAQPLTNPLKTFAKQIVNATHGLIIEDLSDADKAVIRATLKAHSAALFPAGKLVRFRKSGDNGLKVYLLDAPSAA